MIISVSSITSSNLLLRIFSAVVLAPIVLFCIINGGIVFSVFILAIATLAVLEWIRIVRIIGQPLLYLTSGAVYFVLTFVSFVHIRFIEGSGLYLCLMMLLAVWGSDIFAYVLGRLIGGAKMSPTISPKKTWAGYVGALIGSAAVMVTCVALADYFSVVVPHALPVDGYNYFLIAFVGALIGVVGQSGDLLESYFKRRANIKDSGNIIPGHGGILDRLDSILLVSPAFLAFCKWSFIP